MAGCLLSSVLCCCNGLIQIKQILSNVQNAHHHEHNQGLGLKTCSFKAQGVQNTKCPNLGKTRELNPWWWWLVVVVVVVVVNL
jgi:hypothetical protein